MMKVLNGQLIMEKLFLNHMGRCPLYADGSCTIDDEGVACSFTDCPFMFWLKIISENKPKHMTTEEIQAAVNNGEKLQVRSMDGGWINMQDRNPLSINPRYIRRQP